LRGDREQERDRRGVSNVFSVTGDADAAWRGCLAALSAPVGDLPLVGYAREDDLEVARRCGFTPVAPSRVWMKGDLADSFGSLRA